MVGYDFRKNEKSGILIVIFAFGLHTLMISLNTNSKLSTCSRKCEI